MLWSLRAGAALAGEALSLNRGRRWPGSASFQVLRRASIFGITPGHFTGRNLMKRTIIGASIIAIAVMSLSGCWESEADKKAKEQQEASEKFWNITPPDESQDKGFKP
jgi:hypothetical protein